MDALLTIALRNLIAAKRRTILLGGALTLVTMLLVLLMALSQGLSSTIVRSATTLSAGHVNVAGFYKVTTRDAAPIVTEVEKLKEIVRENTSGLDYLIDRHRGWAKVISDTSSMFAGLAGIDVKQEQALLEQLQLDYEDTHHMPDKSAVLSDPGKLSEPNTALIFAAQAKRLEVGVGDVLTLTTQTMDGTSNTSDVRIVAIAKDVGMMSNWRVFVSRATLLELYQMNEDTAGAIMVYLDDIARASEVMEHLRTVFLAKGYDVMEHAPKPFYMKLESVWGEDWTGQKLDLTIWEDEVSFLTWIVTAVDTVSYVLVTILLIIIAIGIINTMWISVRERTAEIGTMRAIGMRRRRVLLMFVLETLILGFAATSLGGILGATLGLAIDAAHFKVPIDAMSYVLMSDTLHLEVRAGHVIMAVLAFTAVTALAALGPAFRASRLQPVTAIHHLG
jgi:putative ABC transport system permease protein